MPAADVAPSDASVSFLLLQNDMRQRRIEGIAVRPKVGRNRSAECQCDVFFLQNTLGLTHTTQYSIRNLLTLASRAVVGVSTFCFGLLLPATQPSREAYARETGCK